MTKIWCVWFIYGMFFLIFLARTRKALFDQLSSSFYENIPDTKIWQMDIINLDIKIILFIIFHT